MITKLIYKKYIIGFKITKLAQILFIYFGYFNYHGVRIKFNYIKKAAELRNILAQYVLDNDYEKLLNYL
jgi:hypothetical protein